jgi:nitronate monooxygenase
VSSVELVAVVSNAGGLGSYGANSLPLSEIETIAAGIRALTNHPFAINLWINPPPEPPPNADVMNRALECFARTTANLV